MSDADQLNDIEKRRRLTIGIADIVRRFGLDRHHRLEVAAILLDHPVESFNELATEELVTQWHAWYGAEVISTILIERRKGQRV